MSRPTISSAVPAEIAKRISDTERSLTRSKELQIATRADELIAERLAEGPRFHDLMECIDPAELNPYLHIAMMNDSNAYPGDPVAAARLVTAMHQFFNVVRAEAKTIWGDECEALAERELL